MNELARIESIYGIVAEFNRCAEEELNQRYSQQQKQTGIIPKTAG